MDNIHYNSFRVSKMWEKDERERRVGESWRVIEEAVGEMLSEEPSPGKGSQPCFLLLFFLLFGW